MEQRDETAITLHGLFAGYGRGTVLHGITARVPRSGVTAVVGPNGSGKSTLLSVAAGVVAPTGGSVRRSHARRPAVVVQRSAVSDALPITVEETVAMGRWAHRGPWRRLTKRDHRIVMECMAHLGVLDLAPRRLGELSGGQRQRALVAQGLAQESDLLLLDEPTTGLDAEARERISAVLDRAGADGTTVVQATHDLEAAMRADHCLLLAEGRLAAQGAPASVLTPAALAGIWGLPRLR
ncbi:zinc/manganese transport system ATP-binding protein [Spinactinospora alkalitolerans]|uniref:Zinc/manganese transport system ATP-binding protein n=1 Tax=Spinactinospora alkalitolerans TaxID=687207 RepID=A0A852TQU4_9ACTN|nr:zinc ABC transporter ATP-binding protein AztA [Spinactinospora alkalitolerans]NYE45667.1 zinc/manganese transport system ATP-binding protein [Spinactinospora alkalitolerans]